MVDFLTERNDLILILARRISCFVNEPITTTKATVVIRYLCRRMKFHPLTNLFITDLSILNPCKDRKFSRGRSYKTIYLMYICNQLRLKLPLDGKLYCISRKYRPATFDSVVGQKALTTTLKNAILTQKLAHAYLFCGPRGVGKTTCAASLPRQSTACTWHRRAKLQRMRIVPCLQRTTLLQHPWAGCRLKQLGRRYTFAHRTGTHSASNRQL
mgnify:CR=1 FL=1